MKWRCYTEAETKVNNPQNPRLGLVFHSRSFHFPYSPLDPGFGTLCDHGVIPISTSGKNRDATTQRSLGRQGQEFVNEVRAGGTMSDAWVNDWLWGSTRDVKAPRPASRNVIQ